MRRLAKLAVCSVAFIAAVGIAAVTHSGSSKASASPRNGQIAFSDAVDVWNGQVFTMNPNGTARHPRPLPWETAPPTGPVWSPDGSRLLVQVHANPASGQPPDRPATVSPDGSNVTVLNPDQGHVDGGCQAWSPDGTRLLCAGGSDARPGGGIFSIWASDGGDFKWLTDPPAGVSDGVGDYSPDGTRFVFIRATSDENGALFVENTDGTGLHQITPYGVPRADDFERMDWSPDGSEILFGGENWSLYTIHPDGTGLTEIVHGGQGDCPCAFYPTWSPDGTRIAYAFNPGARSDLYTANPDGTHRTRITNTPGEGEGWASWGTHPLASTCTSAEKAKRAKALADYRRNMTVQRKAFFRTHHSGKARAAFVKAQSARLKTLAQRVAACT